METKVLNYRILLTPELHHGKTVYNAYCPALGVADWGKTVEQAILHIQGAIESYLESLIKHKQPIPVPDSTDYMVATASVVLPSHTKLTFI